MVANICPQTLVLIRAASIGLVFFAIMLMGGAVSRAAIVPGEYKCWWSGKLQSSVWALALNRCADGAQAVVAAGDYQSGAANMATRLESTGSTGPPSAEDFDAQLRAAQFGGNAGAESTRRDTGVINMR